jgi:FAD/FMN-containing dehydrogenase
VSSRPIGPPPRRLRPGDASWPSDADWAELNRQVGGRLLALESPFVACRKAPDGAECAEALRHLKNPYWLGDQPALTQTSGWLDAWRSAPSAFAVAAETTDDVAAVVSFARTHDLRLVVKGGGHSYHGASNSAGSLLLWTRAMNDVVLHEAFVPEGCAETIEPQPAVSVGAGAIWIQVYDAVMTRAGRYVQGGGCMTVGVAGLIQSGGFGSFSKGFGLAAAGLLEAQVVTADGVTRVVNARNDPDLFWALKGGGGGTFGVVTRLTLRTRELPPTLGIVFATIRAQSDGAFRDLIARMIRFYRERLFNPHWGEQIAFEPTNTVRIGMVFQSLSRRDAEEVWRPFFDWVTSSSEDLAWDRPPSVEELPGRQFWDGGVLEQIAPERIIADDRPGAREGSFLWAGNIDEAGWFLHGYSSAWLPATLLENDRQGALVEALYAGSRHWGVSLHFNKALAGASAADLAAARDTAMNPVVLESFALAVIIAEGPPAYLDTPGARAEATVARSDAAAVRRARDEMSAVVPTPGSYWSESDFFIRDWQDAFWGSNYPRLVAVKRAYDPTGLFFVHHGAGMRRMGRRWLHEARRGRTGLMAAAAGGHLLGRARRRVQRRAATAPDR